MGDPGMAAPPQPLKSAMLHIRLHSEHRDRLLALLERSVPQMKLLAEWPRLREERQRGEKTLLLSPRVDIRAPKHVPDQRREWSCPRCTFINSNPLGLICSMCGSPRDVTEWAGFSRPDTEAQRTQLAASFAICATAVRMLAAKSEVDRIFETGGICIVTHVAPTWPGLLEVFTKEAYATPHSGEPFVLRARCKRDIRERLIREFMENTKGGGPGCRLNPDPTAYTHVFSAVGVGPDTAADIGLPQLPLSDGEILPQFLYSVISRKNDYASIATNNQPVPQAQQVCRAHHKIEELAHASSLVAEAFATAGASGCRSAALDIGAAPGGWTAYLAERFAVVLAIDPAELDADVVARSNVKHIRCKLQPPEAPPNHDGSDRRGEDALEQIREVAAAAAATPALICCDINQPPTEAVNIALRALPAVSGGCVVAVTLKLFRRGVEANRKQRQEARNIMERVCESVEELWLFGNTFHERTLVGRVRSPGVSSDVDTVEEMRPLHHRLHIVLLGEPEDQKELTQILRLCHAYGVGAVHTVRTGEGSLSSTVVIEQIRQESKKLSIAFEEHDTIEACTRTLDEVSNLFEVVIGNSPSEPSPEKSQALYDASFGDKDAVGICICFGHASVSVATRVIVTLPGLQQHTPPSAIVSALLGEVLRQQVTNTRTSDANF